MSADSTNGELIKSLIFRICGMGLGFVATSVLIRELGAASYGTWAALTSLLTWVQLSDFGVGYALKNRIAGAPRPNEMLPLVSGVFQFYVLLSIIISTLFIFFGNQLAIVEQYKTESFILYIGTILFFPLTIGSAVLQGMRKNSISSLMGLAQGFLWLSFVLLLSWTTSSLILMSILYISIVLIIGAGQCAIGVIQLVGRPRNVLNGLLNFDNLRLAYPLCGIGIRFMLLQISSVILFSLGTYLTYSNLSPEDAAKFDVLFKFFQLPLTLFNMVISVYWVEISRSIAIKDQRALRKAFIRLHAMAFGVSLLMLLFTLVIASPLIYIYTGGKISTSISDAFAFWILISVQIFAYAGAVFLNAAEKLREQIIIAAIEAALLIPTVLFFYEKQFGFSAVPLATALLIIPSLFYCNWAAYHHVIKKTGQVHIL